MASHRKPRQHPLTGATARTAAGLALAGAATATVLDGSAQAAPHPTPSQLRTQIDRYYQEAEAATERYNGAKEKADRAESTLEGLQDEAARRTARLNTARNALGSVATAQYREGSLPTSVRLLTASSPEQYLERASMTDRAGVRRSIAVTRYRHELRDVEQVRTTAGGRLAELRKEKATLARHKRAVESKLIEARKILERLPEEHRAAVARGDAATGAAPVNEVGGVTAAVPAALGTSGGASGGTAQAATGRAAQAVAYAYSALGKPYVWGATGPSAFDCSGLAQAAWRAAGVSLPRTTYTQINAGRRISRGALAPGDLVFFYSGVSHVGIYVGGGRMIHAPHPGAPVRVASISEMPFVGASRPA
ncbi:C40 family peptidase [Streptomyces albireticuli]|uniref:C40 family peptidase n=1 Tax=Streptomyces albireticuli TaxID=1940 RepID=UPI0036805021